MKIFKYQIPILQVKEIELPDHAEVASVIAKDNQIWLYINLREDVSYGRTQKRMFTAFPTGESSMTGYTAMGPCIGTVVTQGYYVWHVYEVWHK